jgi:hypothetical protein
MVSINDIAAWRIRIFSSLLSVVLTLGTIAAVPSIPLLLRQGLWPVAVMDAIALAWIFGIWRLESWDSAAADWSRWGCPAWSTTPCRPRWPSP